MGVINQAVVDAASEGYKLTFNNAFDAAMPRWNGVAMEVPSSGSKNTYLWLASLPQMRQWVGERQVRNLKAHSYTIENDEFELTISVPQTAFEDDELGTYTPVMSAMGSRARMHPDKLVFDLLPAGFTTNGYDGVPFFSTNHPDGPDAANWSNAGTSALSANAFNTAITNMMSLRDAEGEPLEITDITLVVPPALEKTAREILEAQELTGAGTNVQRGRAKLLVAPRLAGHPTKWFLVAELHTLKPFIFQNRRSARFTAKDRLDDDNMFWNREAVYGVDARYAAGYGLPQLAYGSTGAG